MNKGIRDISERVCPFLLLGLVCWLIDFTEICKENSQHSVNKSVFLDRKR